MFLRLLPLYCHHPKIFWPLTSKINSNNLVCLGCQRRLKSPIMLSRSRWYVLLLTRHSKLYSDSCRTNKPGKSSLRSHFSRARLKLPVSRRQTMALILPPRWCQTSSRKLKSLLWRNKSVCLAWSLKSAHLFPWRTAWPMASFIGWSMSQSGSAYSWCASYFSSSNKPRR